METASKFQLVYSLEGQSKTIQSLSFGEHILGRSVECEIRLPDPIISRQHARVDVLPDGCWVMDLGSANGTQLDGKPLSPRKRTSISCGQTITIGPYSLTIEMVEEGVNAQATIMEVLQEIKPEAAKSPEPTIMAKPSVVEVFRLQVQKAGEPEQTFNLTDGEWLLGRGEDCPIRLQDAAASRHHARLRIAGKNAWLSDLGSRNGTLRNGVKLLPNQEYPIASQDTPGMASFSIGPLNMKLDLILQATAVEGEFVAAVSTPAQPRPSTPQPVAGQQMVADMTKPLNLMGFERVTIGRAPDNLMVINHPMVSRYHAVIERMGTRYRILDLHSHNGVYLNGQRITNTSWLKEGDRIKVGQEQFVFTGTTIDRSTPEGYTIDVRNLNKWVSKDTNLLKDISLYIGANEFVGLVGMSGAGKTTLQDAINGYRPATDGQVLVSGIDLYENYNMFRNDIGYVPQRDIVHMELTPRASLDYAAQLRMPPDTAKEERSAAIEVTLNDLGIAFRADTQNSRLSGGQLKRVSIGVELLTRPKLFFLDEPTSGLDPGTEYDMMKLLRRLADQGRTILIITHATKNVMLCDKVIILARGGYMAYFGPPEDALTYFDRYRTPRERLEKEMEFDDIYRILNDDSKGEPQEWGKRYREEAARLAQAGQRRVAPPEAQKALPLQKGQTRQISALRQFIILSTRSLNILAQDKVSLGLMLMLAPLLGVMNFIWGNNLFDPMKGNSPKTMVMWFMSAIIAVLVGSLSSVREIVKEADIYKRERAVGLKILPYALSKVWIGVVLAIYSGLIILFCVVVLCRPVMPGIGAYLAAMVTMVLGIVAGYLLGLVISAGVPNQNAALIVLIAVIVPQLLFAGVLYPLESIPGGVPISYLVNSRWTFEAFVRGTGVFDPLVNDPCWGLTKEARLGLTDEMKKSCTCMGSNIFKTCANIPGIQSKDYYDDVAKAALDKPEPIKPKEPTKIPSPTPLASPTSVPSPTPYPTPTPIPMGSDLHRYQELSQDQNQEYSDEREDQFDDFRQAMEDQRKDYADAQKEQLDNFATTSRGQFEDYADAMDKYGDELSHWQKDRESAVAAAESILSNTYDDYGRAFKGSVFSRWVVLVIQCFVMFGIILYFQKRKDVI